VNSFPLTFKHGHPNVDPDSTPAKTQADLLDYLESQHRGFALWSCFFVLAIRSVLQQRQSLAYSRPDWDSIDPGLAI